MTMLLADAPPYVALRPYQVDALAAIEDPILPCTTCGTGGFWRSTSANRWNCGRCAPPGEDVGGGEYLLVPWTEDIDLFDGEVV